MTSAIETPLSKRLGLKYPIVCAPMFLISNVEMVLASAKAGILGAMPSLNCRTHEQFRQALDRIRNATDAAFGINLTIKLTDPERLEQDLEACLEYAVPVIMTSYGNPAHIAKAAHEAGSLVFHDVVGLAHAQKAATSGADAIIAVASGAGGHAGSMSPFVLIPYLKEKVELPIIAAGCISSGEQMAASFALGADLVYLGTRFIASTECGAPPRYKDLVVSSAPDDIVYTDMVSGVPASFIKQTLPEGVGSKEEFQAKVAAGELKRWKDVWSAGQGVGLINEIKPIGAIVEDIVEAYEAARDAMP